MAPDPPEGVADEAPEPGSVVTAVQLEIGGIPGADERPGLAAIAKVMAKVLDDPTAVPSYAAASRQLVAVLDFLHRRARRQGKLTAVREISHPDEGVPPRGPA